MLNVHVMQCDTYVYCHVWYTISCIPFPFRAYAACTAVLKTLSCHLLHTNLHGANYLTAKRTHLS